MALLLGSTASLLAHTLPTSLSIKPKALIGRYDNDYTCGQAWILAFPNPDCDFLDTTFALGIINDTAGSVMPLSNTSWIRSLSYSASPTKNATECPYIQFSFFNSDNQSIGWTFIAPGQNRSSCVKFNSAAVSYSAVTMSAGVPEDLLEQEYISGHGNLEDGYPE
jgi:hypothetical protein